MNDMMRREIAAQAEILAECLRPLTSRVAGIPRPEGWIMAGGCGDSAFAPAASRSAAIEAHCPTQMVVTSFLMNCIVS